MDILIYSLLTNFLYYCSGRLFISQYNLNFNTLFFVYFKGIVFISFVALLFNFFIKLDATFNGIIYLIIFISFFVKNSLQFNKSELLFLIISSFITTALILFSTINRPDAGLYHLPYISLLNEHKIILGVTNINFRFGLTSIMQYISALNNNHLFNENGVSIPLASIVSFFYIYFLNDIWNVFKKKNQPDIGNFFSLLVTIYISYKLLRYSGFGNDVVPHITFFYLISYILKNDFKNLNIIKILLISVFIFINKPTLGVVFIIPVIIYLMREKLLSKKFISIFYSFPLFFLYLWLIKNLLISGCLLYPIKLTCFENLPWTNKTQIVKVSTLGQAWSKGWSDKETTNIKMSDFNKNFNWIDAWSGKHLKYILKIIIPYLIILTIITILIRKKYCLYKKKDEDLSKRLILSIVTCFFGVLFFFLIFPLYRYGYSYLISFFILIYLISIKNFVFSKNSANLFKYIFFITLILFSLKQFQKIYNNFENSRWPNIYTLNEKGIINNYKLIKINDNFTYYQSTSGDYLCMYSNSPCTSDATEKNLKHKVILGYSSIILK